MTHSPIALLPTGALLCACAHVHRDHAGRCHVPACGCLYWHLTRIPWAPSIPGGAR